MCVGVSQGSVLGALLICHCTCNDVLFNMSCTTVLNVDDTTLLNNDKDIEGLLYQTN